MQENPTFGFSELAGAPQVFEADKWYRAEVEWQLGGGLVGRLFDSDGVTLLSSVSASSTLFTSGGIAFRAAGHVKAFDTITVDTGGDAVPEPASLLLLSAGVVGFAVRRRRTR